MQASLTKARKLAPGDAWNNPPACQTQGEEPFASTNALSEAIQLSFRNALVLNVGAADSARRTYGCLFGLDKHNQPIVPASASKASTGQAFASGLLIFLLLLAVRNMLRLK